MFHGNKDNSLEDSPYSKTGHYFCDMDVKLESSWKELLASEFEQDYFKHLTDFVRKEYASNPGAIFPKPGEIFRALDSCPVDKVKVVIIGQDPYPTRGHANGMCFSLNPGVRPFAKSLINIFKEIESDLGKPFPENGDLSRWADQGVLLLNAILTVREGQPLSHKDKGWERFTDALVQRLAEQRRNLVFLLWGSKAIDKVAGLDLSEHCVLRSVHPSPLSAHRGFFGCRHFSKANAYLEQNGLEKINW